jgi:hypothetical protein
MAKIKYDGVVEAAHYSPDGKIKWVRAYLRRGATFSDHQIIDRETLVENLKSGKKIMTGKRIPLLAGTFEVQKPVHLLEKNGKQVLVTGDLNADQDLLESVPVI